jgi:hypothetical protein
VDGSFELDFTLLKRTNYPVCQNSFIICGSFFLVVMAVIIKLSYKDDHDCMFFVRGVNKISNQSMHLD